METAGGKQDWNLSSAELEMHQRQRKEEVSTEVLVTELLCQEIPAESKAGRLCPGRSTQLGTRAECSLGSAQ